MEACEGDDLPAEEEGIVETRLKVFRFDPKVDHKPHYDVFDVSEEPGMRVLDLLNKVRWEMDPSLSYRMSCGHGICGSDGVTINGEADLACRRLVSDLPGPEVVVEPLGFFPVVKDLVVDLSGFFARMRAVHPEGWDKMDPVAAVEEARQAESDRRAIGDAIKCIQCACCTASCPVMLGEDSDFVGPAAALLMQRYVFDTRTRDTSAWIEVASKPHGAQACRNYFVCTRVCPKGIRVTWAINLTKAKIVDRGGGRQS